MSGSKSGVSTRLLDLEPRALYTHCYWHALNLAAQDTLKGIKVMGDSLDTVYEITKLIENCPSMTAFLKSSRMMSAVLDLLEFVSFAPHAGQSKLKLLPQ
jgi:hypothetical protein